MNNNSYGPALLMDFNGLGGGVGLLFVPLMLVTLPLTVLMALGIRAVRGGVRGARLGELVFLGELILAAAKAAEPALLLLLELLLKLLLRGEMCLLWKEVDEEEDVDSIKEWLYLAACEIRLCDEEFIFRDSWRV